MTLSGVMAVILRYYADALAFKAKYVKSVKARPILPATKCSKNNLVLATYGIRQYSKRFHWELVR